MTVKIRVAIEKTRDGKKLANYLVIDGMIGPGIALKARDADRIIKHCNLKISSVMPNSGGHLTQLFD